MSPEQVTVDPIELNYTLTSDDWLDGFATQRRHFRRTMLIVGVVAVLVVAVVASGSFRNVSAGGFVAVLAVVFLGLLLLKLLLGSRSRWIYRWHVRLIMRGNPWLSQPIRATVADTGLHLTNATVSSTAAWSQYPLYLETDRSFVLLASANIGAAVLILPKRGLGGADPTSLRSMLDTHSQRRS